MELNKTISNALYLRYMLDNKRTINDPEDFKIVMTEIYQWRLSHSEKEWETEMDKILDSCHEPYRIWVSYWKKEDIEFFKYPCKCEEGKKCLKCSKLICFRCYMENKSYCDRCCNLYCLDCSGELYKCEECITKLCLECIQEKNRCRYCKRIWCDSHLEKRNSRDICLKCEKEIWDDYEKT